MIEELLPKLQRHGWMKGVLSARDEVKGREVLVGSRRGEAQSIGRRMAQSINRRIGGWLNLRERKEPKNLTYALGIAFGTDFNSALGT